LSPTITALNYPTTFEVDVNSTNPISKYSWDFGDGDSQNTTTAETTYTYDEEGDYSLKITVQDSTGKISSKSFDITVGPASIIVPTLLDEAETNILNLKSQISDFSDFEKRGLNSSLNLDGTEQTIKQLQSDSETATSESDYQNILGELLKINVPSEIIRTASSNGLIFYPDSSNINLDILSQISGEDIPTGQEDNYKNAILSWEGENTNMLVVYNEISGIYGGDEKPLLKTFQVTITKNGTDANPYLIIQEMNNLMFDKNYSMQEDSGYVYMTLDEPQTNIIFSTSDDVNIVSLPMFVSPKISDLVPVSENVTQFQENSKKWIIFGIVVGAVILVAIGLWIGLHMWYKIKYENYLFKNRNNLYNIITYIESEKKKGTEEREIKNKLRKAGWNSEQIGYALKKDAGKKI
jgi:PKD repeat protein